MAARTFRDEAVRLIGYWAFATSEALRTSIDEAERDRVIMSGVAWPTMSRPMPTESLLVPGHSEVVFVSKLEFSRIGSKLQLIAADNAVIGSWDAANNVDSRSKGIWPNGLYDFDYYVAHPGDPPNSAYGSHGIFVFDVADREGMGIHSGREGIPDGLGRTGFRHCTMGCIRTTDEATAQFVRTHAIDPIISIAVGD